MLAEQETVIGGHDQCGVLPQIVAVEIIEQLAEQEIAQRDHGIIIGAQLVAFGRQFVDAAVARPVADRSVPAGIERRLETGGRGERLVRIEGLDLEQPVVRLAVAVEEVKAVGKALDRRKVFFLLDEFAVDDVLRAVLPPLGRELPRMILLTQPFPGRLHHRLPGVAFLAADELEGVVAVVIGGAAILPVMRMVGDQMAVDAGVVEQLRHRVVERLQRAPASVQKRQTSGQHVAARRHARQAADIMAVKRKAARGEPIEVRRRDAFPAIGAEQMTIQRIEQDEDSFHGATFWANETADYFTAPWVSPATM